MRCTWEDRLWQNDIQQRADEQIVDIPVLKVVEKLVQERISERIVEQIADVSVRQKGEQLVEVPKTVSREKNPAARLRAVCRHAASEREWRRLLFCMLCVI